MTPQLLAPLSVQRQLLFLGELVPDADRASAYARLCDELWTRLQQQGVAVLELVTDDEFSAFGSALETCAVFFSADESVKQGAQSAVPGEGYAVRPGKELLAVRPGAPAWGSGRSRTQHAALQKASSRADRLCRGLLCALCRSPGLDVHSGRVLGLLDDAPLLGQASASLLRCARYSPDPHAAQLLAFAPHHDRGVLTLVASAQEQGLQVRLPQQGQGAGAAAGAWVDVPLGPGRVAVLCGYSLSYALGGLLQPALHRVRPVAVAGCGGAAGGSAATAGGGRVSLAYELCFRPNPCVDPAAITQGAAEQLPAAAAAAGEGGAASRPALLTSALMERFEATHPVSINGGVRVKQDPGANTPAAAAVAARRQREENGTAARDEAPAVKRGRHDGGPEAADEQAGSPAAAPTALSQPAPAGGGGHGGQAEAAAGENGDDRINIIVKDQSGSEVHFQVKRSTRVGKVFDAYYCAKGMDNHSCRFLYDGSHVRDHITVGQLGMKPGDVLPMVEDGDVIDCIIGQAGN